jgi:S-adenosyl methyltransferase
MVDEGEMSQSPRPPGGSRVPAGAEVPKPAPGRLHDYYPGGQNNLQINSDAARRLLAVVPEVPDYASAAHGFHQRAVIWLAAEQGIRQFIDIGFGLAAHNTHEAAQKVAPDARVLYVANDPTMLAPARAQLAGQGTTRVIAADPREPGTTLDHPETRELIDFSEPVGLVMTGLLHFVSDQSDPRGLVARYIDMSAPGSYLVLSHLTGDQKPPAGVQAFLDLHETATGQLHMRTKAEVERFFAGLELVPPYAEAAPGLAWLGEWGAEDVAAADSDGSRWGYCGVARRP